MHSWILAVSLKYYSFIITSIFLVLQQSKKERVFLNLSYEVSNFKDAIRNVLEVKLFNNFFEHISNPSQYLGRTSVSLYVCAHAYFKCMSKKKNEEDSNLENVNCMLKNVKPFYFMLPSLEFC